MPHTHRTAMGAVGLAVCLGLSACSQPPFDERAPWVPTQENADASFAGGVLGGPPAMGFALFEQDRPERVDDSVSIPTAEGENPWATPTRDVVVTLCYGSLINSLESVRQSAAELCPPDTTPHYLGGDTFWNQCPLIQPSRAAFQCLSADADDGGEEADGKG